MWGAVMDALELSELHGLNVGQRQSKPLEIYDKCNSQAPQPPTGFFVSFDVSLLGHRAHEFSVVV